MEMMVTNLTSLSFVVELLCMISGLLSVSKYTEFVSLPRLLSSPAPKLLISEGLTRLLVGKLRPSGVVFNEEAFSEGLTNPDLPVSLLDRLEELISSEEEKDWKLSKRIVAEFDKVIEEVESFNPLFLKSLEESRASGRVSSASVKKELGL